MSLELRCVSRRFGAQVALDRVSLNVRPGDCYGFIGHNGAIQKAQVVLKNDCIH